MTGSVVPATAGAFTDLGSGSGRVAGSRPESGGSNRGSAGAAAVDSSAGSGLVWQPVMRLVARTTPRVVERNAVEVVWAMTEAYVNRPATRVEMGIFSILIRQGSRHVRPGSPSGR
ncbi:MAG: hypothetical protein CMJ34_07970 [Phycisphaerae bacterium]|nr:hypothetical protein [Phycisphaerae bacterium]